MRNKTEIEKEINNPNFDWLGRETFIEDFIKHIFNQQQSKHICLNGVWGSGKTTTVLGIIKQIKESETKPLILYLDSWKYEHYEEPLFALLKVMQSELPDIFESIESEFQEKGIEPQMGLNLPFFSFNLSKGKENVHHRLLNEAEYIDALHEVMISAINKFKEEKANELIIFIDELDRAKPSFALRTIEMFHHLQDKLPTHIVYSVDMNQLSSIIKHYYGYEYNVEVFTHKVFDEVITLKKIDRRNIELYIDHKLYKLGSSFNKERIRNIMMKYLKLEQLESLRTLTKTCENIIKKLKSGYFKAIKSDAIIEIDYKYYLANKGYEVYWGYVELLIVLEVFSLSSPMKVYEFLRGETIKELFDFILENEEGTLNKEIGYLIEKSYYYDKKNEENKSYLELNENERIIGLRRLFVPKDKEYDRKSIFGGDEVF